MESSSDEKNAILACDDETLGLFKIMLALIS